MKLNELRQKLIGSVSTTSEWRDLIHSLVLKLLARISEEAGVTLETTRGADGFAASGWDKMPGPVFIDIRSCDAPSGVIKHQLTKLSAAASKLHAKTFLWIFGSPLKQSLREKYRAMFAAVSKDTELKLEIWDIEQLEVLAAAYPAVVASVVPELAPQAVKNMVAKSVRSLEGDWKRTREQQLQVLKSAHAKNDLVLCLGAGVSLDAGLPDWNRLLRQLLVALVGGKLPRELEISDDEKIWLATRLGELQAGAPLLQARYVRAGLGDKFAQTVSKLLYDGQVTPRKSLLLEAISKLCIPRRSGPGVRAVITYNFDDLLEQNLDAVGIQHHSVYRDAEIPTQDELGIYHVHGFLPRNVQPYDGLAESLLVFSEEGYHNLVLDPYHWTNIVQLNFLRESVGLFIGLSMTDPNLRRLLEIAAKKNKVTRHFVFQKRLSTDSLFTGEKAEIRTDAIKAFLQAHHTLEEGSLDELGLHIIWVDDYSEIPKLISQISARN
jgi:hypothetical protein